MMNIVALCLLVTSLATSGVLSPYPNKQDDNQLVVEKEGLKVIVVEYERDGTGKTKISISPQPENQEPNGHIRETEHETNGNIGESEQRKTEQDEDESSPSSVSVKDLICDAFGKCKHKITGVYEKGKEVVSKKVHECSEGTCEKAKNTVKTAIDTGKTLKGDVRRNVSEDTDIVRREVANKAKEGLETADKVKDKVKEGYYKAKEGLEDAEPLKDFKEKAKTGVEKAENLAEVVKDRAKTGLEKAEDMADTVKGKAKTGLEKAEDMADTVKDKAKTGFEKAKTGLEKAEDMAGTVKDKAKAGLEKTEDMADSVKDKAREGVEATSKVGHNVKKKAKQSIETAETAVSRLTNFVGELWAYLTAAIGPLLGVIHLLGFAMAYGMSVWITFVSSYVLANALPRQQFAMVQSKIYPLYFKAMEYSIGVALLGHLLSQRTHVFDSKAEVFQGYNLIVSLLMVFANLSYLEPKATKVMFDRMKVEKEEGRGGQETSRSTSTAPTRTPTTPTTTTTTAPTMCEVEKEAARSQIVGLNDRLKKLNSLSSAVNIGTLMSLTWHLVYLGQRLHMSSCH